MGGGDFGEMAILDILAKYPLAKWPLAKWPGFVRPYQVRHGFDLVCWLTTVTIALYYIPRMQPECSQSANISQILS